MAKAKIILPTVVTEGVHFYKGNEEILKPHIGKPYISYSSVDSWLNYREDFIKQKFVGIKTPDSVYSALGNYVGTAIENGHFNEDNPYGFEGQENLDFNKLRVDGAEYEKIVVIDCGDYVIIGFIDIFFMKDDKATVIDVKSGGKKKEEKYKGEDYIQVVLYAHYIQEILRIPIGYTGVYFIRRENSHINPPLKIGKEQFHIPLEYNEKRTKYALKVVKNAVKEISEVYKTYIKYFPHQA